MLTFKYKALSPDGVKVDGVIKAIDEFAAVDKIKATNPVVLKIEEVKDSRLSSILNAEMGPKYDPKALSVMCSQFAIVLGAGVPADSCLKMIAAQTKDKKLKKMLQLSAEDVAQGTPIATAFEKNYSGLPLTFLETIRAGEISGTLDSSFASLAVFYEKSYTLNQKVKAAMTYPMFVVGVAIIVLIVVMGFVMPKFIGVFDDLGGELPGITVFLINVTEFFSKYWLIMIGVLAIVTAAVIAWTHTEQGSIQWSKLMLKIPVLGNLNILQGATEFSSTMATLLNAGLTVSDAMEITSRVMSNYVLGLEIRSMSEKLKTGSELGDLMRKNTHFPEVLKEMCGVGEKTGELEKTLETISTFYTNEYNYEVNQAIAKLEPTLMVFLAIFAGFIVISLYLPMFTMYNLM